MLCRIQHEKVRDLSTLIYFIERTGCATVHPSLKQAFEDECSRIIKMDFGKMDDRSLRIFTWVYLAAKCFEGGQFDRVLLTETHLERMDSIAFDAEMCS